MAWDGEWDEDLESLVAQAEAADALERGQAQATDANAASAASLFELPDDDVDAVLDAVESQLSQHEAKDPAEAASVGPCENTAEKQTPAPTAPTPAPAVPEPKAEAQEEEEEEELSWAELKARAAAAEAAEDVQAAALARAEEQSSDGATEDTADLPEPWEAQEKTTAEPPSARVASCEADGEAEADEVDVAKDGETGVAPKNDAVDTADDETTSKAASVMEPEAEEADKAEPAQSQPPASEEQAEERSPDASVESESPSSGVPAAADDERILGDELVGGGAEAEGESVAEGAETTSDRWPAAAADSAEKGITTERSEPEIASAKSELEAAMLEDAEAGYAEAMAEAEAEAEAAFEEEPTRAEVHAEEMEVEKEAELATSASADASPAEDHAAEEVEMEVEVEPPTSEGAAESIMSGGPEDTAAPAAVAEGEQQDGEADACACTPLEGGLFQTQSSVEAVDAAAAPFSGEDRGDAAGDVVDTAESPEETPPAPSVEEVLSRSPLQVEEVLRCCAESDDNVQGPIEGGEEWIATDGGGFQRGVAAEGEASESVAQTANVAIADERALHTPGVEHPKPSPKLKPGGPPGKDKAKPPSSTSSSSPRLRKEFKGWTRKFSTRKNQWYLVSPSGQRKEWERKCLARTEDTRAEAERQAKEYPQPRELSYNDEEQSGKRLGDGSSSSGTAAAASSTDAAPPTKSGSKSADAVKASSKKRPSSTKPPTEAQLGVKIGELLNALDSSKATLGAVLDDLTGHFGVDVRPQKAAVKETIVKQLLARRASS